jgi:hypothetical protein
LIEPFPLQMRVVHRHEWPESIRADVACDDHEIAWRNVRQEPVLIAEGHDAHDSQSRSDLEPCLPRGDIRFAPRDAPATDAHWLRERSHLHLPVDRRDVERGTFLDGPLVQEPI